MRLLISFCIRVQSASVFTIRYSRISSAYKLIFEVTFRGISFTKHKKRRGAKTVPWGTPDVTIEG